ncbi:MAG: RecB-like helicase [Campylobacteraceae bacterium]|nr:RecB-like helicase [Campylobacteraceae bacterium]
MSSFENFKALKASAGSGKTFALTIRYLSLVFSGVSPNRILALTFTKKAANEMNERIISTFLNLKDESRKAQVDEICKLLNLSKEALFAKRDEIYDEFLNSDIKISTFDSFFSTILRSFATNFGLDANFDIENDMSEVLNREFSKNISKNPELLDEISSFIVDTNSTTSKFLSSLNEISTQMGRLDYPKGLKFPDDSGFKKTQNRVLEFLDEVIKTADESVKKQALMLKEKLGASLFSILKESFISRESLNYRTYSKLHAYSPQIDTLYLELKEAIKEYLSELEAYKLSKFSEILELYIKTKRDINKKLNRLTFNDLPTMIFELLNKPDMINMIYFRLDSRIEHILIDEFQDTSVIQYKILLPLIEEIVSGYGQSGLGSFFYVGDIKQSIYRFRGAKKEIFTHLADKFPQIKTENLEYNYRSSKAIVKFVNTVFKDVIDGYEDQISKLEVDAKFNPLISPSFNLFEIESDDFGYLKSLMVDDTEEKELVLKTAVDEVKALIKNGANPDNIAVLCFKNENIDTLKDMLNKEGISSNGEGKRTLLELPTTRAIIEYAKFCSTGEEIYALNVERLIGKKLALLKLEKTTKENLVYLIEKLGLGLDDKNTLLLLDEASKYPNIYEFAFRSGDISALNDENRGVSLLTIHKSKGLEFGHVIVCDSFQRGSPDVPNFIKEYDVANESWEIKYRVSGREWVDEEYQNLTTKIKELDREESINKLYVAFTRAVNSLVLIKSNSGYSNFRNEKTDKSGKFLLDIPDFEFGRVIKDKVVKESKKPTKKIELVSIEQQKVAKKGEQVENLDAINFGLAMHYTLEMCASLESKQIKTAILKTRDKFSKFLDINKFEDIEKRVSMLFENETFINLTKNAKVLKEQPFKTEGEIRQIDLIAFKEDEINIIDYKSGTGFSEENEAQVLGYREAVSSFYTDKKVEAYIFYILEDKILVEKV